MSSSPPAAKRALWITRFLLCANCLVLGVCLFQVFGFLSGYQRASSLSKQARKRTPPGSITFDNVAALSKGLQLRSDQKDFLEDFRELEVTGEVLDRAIAASEDMGLELYTRRFAASLLDPKMPVSEVNHRLRHLAALAVDAPKAGSDVAATLEQLAANQQSRGFSSAMLMQAGRAWQPHARLGGNLSRVINRHQRQKSETLRNRGVRVSLSLQPAASESIRSVSRPSASDTKTVGRNGATVSDDDADEDPLRDAEAGSLIQSLADADEAAVLLPRLRSLAIDHPVRKRLTDEVVARFFEPPDSSLPGVPAWVDQLAILWGDDQLFRAFRNIVSSSSDDDVDRVQANRVVRIALADQDAAWTSTLLGWLPKSRLGRSWATERRLFTEDSWPTRMANVLEFLSRERDRELVAMLVEDSLRGAIVRQVFVRRGNWSETVLDQMVRLASGGSDDQSETSWDWLQQTHLDADTKRRLVVRISKVQSEEIKLRLWVNLGAAINPWSEPEFASKLLVQMLSGKRNPAVLADWLRSDGEVNWEVLARAVDSLPPGVVVDPSVSKRLDARLATLAAHGKLKSSPAFTRVAESLGGWATQKLLTDASLEAVE